MALRLNKCEFGLTKIIWHPSGDRYISTEPHTMHQIGKNLKPVIQTNITSQIPPLYEPNEKIQMDFAGPLQDEHLKDSYILASVDRYSRKHLDIKPQQSQTQRNK